MAEDSLPSLAIISLFFCTVLSGGLIGYLFAWLSDFSSPMYYMVYVFIGLLIMNMAYSLYNIRRVLFPQTPA
jgi:hypothetical protein